MLLNPPTVAAWNARRLSRILSEVGGDVAPVAGGWMACDVPGSWADYAAGLGIDQPVSDPDLETLVGFYAQRGRPAGIVTTPYQHPALFQGLFARGFGVKELETVLVRPLADLPDGRHPPAVRFVSIHPATPERVSAFVQAIQRGFHPDGDAPPGMRPIHERVAQNPHIRLWLILHQDAVIGTGGLEVRDEGAALIAGTIHRPWRRQGIHQAFIRFRLAQARTMGCRFALVASTPGGPTERNAMRAGFSVSYTQIGLWNG